MDQAAGEDPTGKLTYFELTTALALLHFRRQGVDFAVLEVGMGGRLDSTNVCDPCLAIITSISFDHMQQLGNTLTAIAREKAGIIKPGVPVVSGVTEPEPRAVIREVARSRRCHLVELGCDFDFRYHPPGHRERGSDGACMDYFAPNHASLAEREGPKEYSLSLIGRHQAANAAVALAAIDQLRQAGWQVSEEAVRAGLAQLVCRARVEVVARQPTVVLDVAHNVASIRALMEVLEESFAADRRLLVFATTQGKDLRGMLEALVGRFDEIVFTRYRNNPRSVPPEQLQALAAELGGRRFSAFADPGDAWEHVREMVGPDDLVCITGSFFIAAEMRRLLAARPLVLPARAEARDSA